MDRLHMKSTPLSSPAGRCHRYKLEGAGNLVRLHIYASGHVFLHIVDTALQIDRSDALDLFNENKRWWKRQPEPRKR
jgi:hypothetical protein